MRYMELLIEKSAKKEKKGVVLLSSFVLFLLMAITTIYGSSMSFIMPLFIVAFSCGYSYIFVYFSAVAISCFFVPSNMVVVVSSIIVGIVLQIGVVFKIVQGKYVDYIVAFVSAITLFAFGMEPISIAITTTLLLIHSFIYKELIPVFMHQTTDVLTTRRMVILSMLIMLSITNILQNEPMYMMVLLRFYILLNIYYIGLYDMVPAILYISIILILQNGSMQNEILSILLPCSIFFLSPPTTKIKTACLYIISHLILPFFITYDYVFHNITILVSALLFVLAPTIQRKRKIGLEDFKEVTNRSRLVQQANTFTELFKQLMSVFKEASANVDAREYIGYMYEDLCSNCSSKEYCYHATKGMSRLVKLANKGIIDNFEKKDIDYIQEYCISPEEYVGEVDKLHDNYQRIIRVNKENQHLRNDLFHEFSLLGNVFDNFSASLSHRQISEDSIKAHLEGYQFEITFLKQYRESTEAYTLEIGLVNITKEAIKEELVPILQMYLNETLDIVSLRDSMSHLGYTSLVLKHKINYTLLHGMQQHAYDAIVCGDSYVTFHQNMDHYLAISDGMGQGKDASKESKLTLEILSKLILNGISLKDTLDSINTLLKIKNQSDMFTTMDLCTINLASAKACFIKYGAYSSFLISQGHITKIECKTLPVGVISHVTMSSYETHLQDGDIIIMASDGVGDTFYEILHDRLHQLDNRHPQEIATYLMDLVLDQNVHDDISIMAIKIVKET